MLVSNVSAVPTQTCVSIGINALSEFLYTLIDWNRLSIEHLKNIVPNDRLFVQSKRSLTMRLTATFVTSRSRETKILEIAKYVITITLLSGSLPLLISNVISSGRSITRSLCFSTTFADTTSFDRSRVFKHP